MELSRTTLGIAVGLAGSVFLGYCVLDEQLFTDPLVQTKLRKLHQKEQNSSSRSANLGGPFPDMSNHEAMSRFFIQQIHLSDELLADGDLEAGVEHLAQAVTVCGRPQFLSVLEQTIPASIFHLLQKKLPEVWKRLHRSMKAGNGAVL